MVRHCLIALMLLLYIITCAAVHQYHVMQISMHDLIGQQILLDHGTDPWGVVVERVEM